MAQAIVKCARDAQGHVTQLAARSKCGREVGAAVKYDKAWRGGEGHADKLGRHQMHKTRTRSCGEKAVEERVGQRVREQREARGHAGHGRERLRTARLAASVPTLRALSGAPALVRARKTRRGRTVGRAV